MDLDLYLSQNFQFVQQFSMFRKIDKSNFGIAKNRNMNYTIFN